MAAVSANVRNLSVSYMGERESARIILKTLSKTAARGLESTRGSFESLTHQSCRICSRPVEFTPGVFGYGAKGPPVDPFAGKLAAVCTECLFLWFSRDGSVRLTSEPFTLS